MAPTIYVITAYKFNHTRECDPPIDSRFLDSDKNYVYYVVDEEIPPVLRNHSVILEKAIDPLLHEAGKKHFAEWSFLLAEAKHGFCSYPLFMISSRFYQKNGWLRSDLNAEWDRLFSYFEEYGWAYLPSYNRPLRWIDLEWKKKMKKEYWKHQFFPFTEKTYELTEEVFNVNISDDYRYTSDLFCNYIGFKSREHLLEYVNFYKPLIDKLFDENYSPKCDLSPYIRSTGVFRNEKPFTFILELLCHLFFFKSGEKFFALHYDGYHEIDEKNTKKRKLHRIRRSLPWLIRKQLGWKWRKWNSEGFLAKAHARLAAWKEKRI